MRVLLVDDEKKFVSALARRLCLRGINAEWACSGDEAIMKVRTGQYDLAVLDVKMPGIGGIELKRKLQIIAPDMKYIFLTGHGSDEDFKIGSAEASSYLSKPLRIEKVIEMIRLALDEPVDHGEEG